MAIRYKTFGKQEYAYKIWNEKSVETGKWSQRSKYLGVVVDKEKGIYERRNEIKRAAKEADLKEQRILDYGDSYFMNEFLKKDVLYPILKQIFGKHTDTLLSLVLFKLQGGSAMRHAELWYDGNAANILFPNAAISTQSISKFLDVIGNEKLHQSFFAAYLKIVCGEKSSILIDSTGFPNQVNMPITEWGYHNGGIEKETRLILAVEKESAMPLYFRYLAGNIGDVSTLITTISEIKKFDVNPTMSIVDAGYYSEDNIKALFEGNVSFITRMPSGRVLYKSLISENCGTIEYHGNAVTYGKRGLFIHKQPIDLYGHPAFAYIVCDPARRGREVSKKILEIEPGSGSFDLQNCGMMILVSSIDMDVSEVIPLYYSRQMAEQLFGISKDDLSILPIRTHTEARFRGLMLLSFISLIVYLKIRNTLHSKNTVEQLLSLMRNLKCKVFSDNSFLVSEVNKKQRLAFETSDILVPKNCGI
jgi:transposase